MAKYGDFEDFEQCTSERSERVQVEGLLMCRDFDYCGFSF
jgi:hypothetical protein